MDKPDSVNAKRKICPYCGESIAESAKKCRYCGEWLEQSQSPARADMTSNPLQSSVAEKTESNEQGEVEIKKNDSNDPMIVTSSQQENIPESEDKPKAGLSRRIIGGIIVAIGLGVIVFPFLALALYFIFDIDLMDFQHMRRVKGLLIGAVAIGSFILKIGLKAGGFNDSDDAKEQEEAQSNESPDEEKPEESQSAETPVEEEPEDEITYESAPQLNKKDITKRFYFILLGFAAIIALIYISFSGSGDSDYDERTTVVEAVPAINEEEYSVVEAENVFSDDEIPEFNYAWTGGPFKKYETIYRAAPNSSFYSAVFKDEDYDFVIFFRMVPESGSSYDVIVKREKYGTELLYRDQQELTPNGGPIYKSVMGVDEEGAEYQEVIMLDVDDNGRLLPDAIYKVVYFDGREPNIYELSLQPFTFDLQYQ